MCQFQQQRKLTARKGDGNNALCAAFVSTSDNKATTERSTKKRVSFSTVTVRNYPLTLGTVNPYSTMSSSTSARKVSLPLTLSWEYEQLPAQSLDEFDAMHPPRRTTGQMRLSADRRRAILSMRDDVSKSEIEEAERMARKCEERRRRYMMAQQQQCRGEQQQCRRRRELPVQKAPPRRAGAPPRAA